MCLLINVDVVYCYVQNRGNTEAIKLDKTTVTLEPEKSSGGGLFVPGKDRVVYRAPERKSLLGKLFHYHIFSIRFWRN